MSIATTASSSAASAMRIALWISCSDFRASWRARNSRIGLASASVVSSHHDRPASAASWTFDSNLLRSAVRAVSISRPRCSSLARSASNAAVAESSRFFALTLSVSRASDSFCMASPLSRVAYETKVRRRVVRANPRKPQSYPAVVTPDPGRRGTVRPPPSDDPIAMPPLLKAIRCHVASAKFSIPPGHLLRRDLALADGAPMCERMVLSPVVDRLVECVDHEVVVGVRFERDAHHRDVIGEASRAELFQEGIKIE